MKRFSMILLSLIFILGFASNVNAASYSSSITVNKSGKAYEYIEGIEVYNNTSGSYNVYTLDLDTYFDSKLTLKTPFEADPGFTYIINNSKVTSSSTKNYYIAQVAILWYQDYLSGNDANISSSLKNYIKNNTNDTVCYYVYKLVNNAINYSANENSIIVDNNVVNFSKNGNYYYSNEINVETYDLKSKPTVKLYNAPKSASIVNNELKASGTGSFQIRIPVSSLDTYYNDDFEVSINGSKSINTTYVYYGSNTYIIYGRVYSSTSNNVEASIPIKMNNFTSTKVRIEILKENGSYLSGVKYYIYNGDCSNKTCNSLVGTYTSKNTYNSLDGILNPGTYTLVIPDYSKYNLINKRVFTVQDNTTKTQVLTIQSTEDYDDNDYDYDDNYNYETSVRIYNNINNSNVYINIFNNNTLVESYKSTNTNYVISLKDGYYTLKDSNETMTVYFRVTNGKVRVYRNGLYETVSYIDLRNINDDYYYDDNYDDDTQYPEDNNYNDNYQDENQNNNQSDNQYKDENTFTNSYDFGDFTVDVENNVETTTTVDVETIDCPITGISSTIKYIIGAIILGTGLYLVIRNVKKYKSNC